ncbi:MAG: hypothetical protein RR854_00340 [Muribaculaceae bacterium]
MNCLTKEESERIALLSQLNIEKVPVEALKELLKRVRFINDRKLKNK